MLDRKLLELAQASNRIHAAASLGAALDLITAAARSIIGAHQAVASLTRDSSWAQAIQAVSLSDKYAAWRSYDEAPDGSGIYSAVCSANRPMRMTQAELERHPAWRGFGAARERHPPMRGWLAAPLRGEDGVNLGLVQLSDKHAGEFDENDELILVQLADMASVAIRNLRLAEEKREADELIRSSFEHAAVGISISAIDGRLLRVNDALCRILGHPAATLLSGGLVSFIHPEDRPATEANLRRLADGTMPSFMGRSRYIRADGSLVWAKCSVSALHGADGRTTRVIALTENVTAEVHLQAERDRAKQEIDRILNTVSDAFYALDAEWRFTYVNDAAERVLRREREELIGQVLWDVFPEVVGTEIHDRYVRARETMCGAEFTVFYAPFDMWCEIRAYPHPAGLTVYFRDVTVQVRAAAEMAEQQKALVGALSRYRRIIDSSVDVIALFDRDGRFVDVSPVVEAVWGYCAEEIIGRSCIALVHPEDREMTRAEALAVIGGRPTNSFQNRYLHADGRVVHMQWSCVWSEADQLSFAVARDITERLQIAERLNQSQRLEAIGQLTGGVAHDFNNLLTVILGNAEVLSEELAADPRLGPLSRLTYDAAQRGAGLVNRLLAFARRQALDPKPLAVDALVEEMRTLLGRTLGDRIAITTRHQTQGWRALADAPQLEAALINVFINARDAMAGGGVLTVETETVTIPPGGDIGPGEFVLVSVADTGAGMAPEVMARAFEPFFTTKPVGKGSGLGLSMVYGFARQSGGAVRIQSAPGQGTTIRLYLPRALAPA